MLEVIIVIVITVIVVASRHSGWPQQANHNPHPPEEQTKLE
jgi:hypothetical protein